MTIDMADGVYDLCWSESHDSLIITAIADGSLIICDLSLPPASNPFRSLHEHGRESHSVDFNVVRKDSFFSSSRDDTVKLWAVDRPASFEDFQEKRVAVLCLLRRLDPRHADVFAQLPAIVPLGFGMSVNQVQP